MAESENDVDQGPPGVQTQVRADQYDMRDDYDDDDQEQRDTALYYKDDGGHARGAYANEIVGHWCEQGHFPPDAMFYFDNRFRTEAGTAQELFPGAYVDYTARLVQGTSAVSSFRTLKKKQNKKKKKKRRRRSRSSSSSSTPSSSSSSGSEDDRPRALRAGDDIKIKASADPPDAATQQAIWEAAAKHPRTVSLAEQELMRRKPNASASQADLMQFQFELMQVRSRSPTPVAFALSGKLIRPNAQLPADVPLPQALPNWTAPLALRYFRPLDGRSLIDMDREAAKSQVITIGNTSFVSSSSATGVPPDPPKSAIEFQAFGERLLEYGLASCRFTRRSRQHQGPHEVLSAAAGTLPTRRRATL